MSDCYANVYPQKDIRVKLNTQLGCLFEGASLARPRSSQSETRLADHATGKEPVR